MLVALEFTTKINTLMKHQLIITILGANKVTVLSTLTDVVC